MTENRIYSFIAAFSFFLLFFVLEFHFKIRWLPLACLLLGVLTRRVFTSRFLEVFSFLLPILPFFASLENKGFPLNYLLLPLFFLCGLLAGDWLAAKEKEARLPMRLPRFYLSFLLLLGISFFFVMLRWSNLTLSPLAIFKDTPLAPTGHRLSFGIVFPVVELALFVLSPLFYMFLKRQRDLRRILVAFLSGQSISIVYSLVQRWQGKGIITLPISGLASDSTAFGFLSTLAILLSWYLFSSAKTKRLGLLFIFVSLIGILNSMTRIGLLAIVLVLFLFAIFSEKKIVSLTVIGIVLAAAFFLYNAFFQREGFNFLSRLKNGLLVIENVLQHEKLEYNAWSNLSSGRDVIWRYNAECLRKYPLTGVGAGNYVFWVMASHPGNFTHHLSANQYSFIASSAGVMGLSAFLLFCSLLFKQMRKQEKCLLGSFLFLLFFNDYLWFSEIFLVFWLFASLGERSDEWPRPSSKIAKGLMVCGFLLFIAFHSLNFSKLHPKNWARAASTAYDYGFSYPEIEKGRGFRWSGAKAGMYVFLEKNNPRARFQLTCSAPLSHLSGQHQAVDIYWRGQLYRRVVFRENGEYSLWVRDSRHREGFLEFRVHPVFNLKKMGLGVESRELGVQVSGPGL